MNKRSILDCHIYCGSPPKQTDNDYQRNYPSYLKLDMVVSGVDFFNCTFLPECKQIKFDENCRFFFCKGL